MENFLKQAVVNGCLSFEAKNVIEINFGLVRSAFSHILMLEMREKTPWATNVLKIKLFSFIFNTKSKCSTRSSLALRANESFI